MSPALPLSGAPARPEVHSLDGKDPTQIAGAIGAVEFTMVLTLDAPSVGGVQHCVLSLLRGRAVVGRARADAPGNSRSTFSKRPENASC